MDSKEELIIPNVTGRTRITIFQNINVTDKPYLTTIDKALVRIKTGKSKDKIEKIRAELDKDKRNNLKKNLPSILFSGEFRERNKVGIAKHSGLICLDYDGVDGIALKEKLKKDPYVFAAFISPSGNQGLKVLVKIPTNDHHGSFLALESHFTGIDKSGKDVSRVCYESYDPDIYINTKSEVFTDIVVIDYREVTVEKPLTDHSVVYEYLKRWLDSVGEYFTEGNRNNYLYKLACACNRFGIGKSEARTNLLYDFVNNTTRFKVAELDDVVRKAYNRTGDFNTAVFDRGEIITVKDRKTITQELLKEELPARDAILLWDIWQDMLREFQDGIVQGETTHIPEIDKRFRWARKEITLMYGIGNHGKTIMMLTLMMLKSIHDGYRWGIFSPEQNPPNDFYNDLIEIYIGMSVMKGDRNQMTMKQYKRAMEFVSDHFFYIYPKNDDHKPELILDRFQEIIVKKKADGVMIDPFNQLDHAYNGNIADYLSVILKTFKTFAMDMNVFFIVIAHCNNKIEVNKATSEIRLPYYTHQIAGGAMWGNKMDNIICYHRPNYRIDPDSTECLFSSQKIKKQRRNGRTGVVKLDYLIDRRMYAPLGQEYINYRAEKDVQKQMEFDAKEAMKNRELFGDPNFPIIRKGAEEINFDEVF